MYLLIEVSDVSRIDIVPRDGATAATVREVCRAADLREMADRVGDAYESEVIADLKRRHAEAVTEHGPDVVARPGAFIDPDRDEDEGPPHVVGDHPDYETPLAGER